MSKKSKQEVKDFMSNKEVSAGNDVIKRYIRGDATGRTAWIYYFYTECTDERVIRDNCQKLFGGRKERAVGYVGAYTHLEKIPVYSIIYRAGFNYSYEQMEANYD